MHGAGSIYLGRRIGALISNGNLDRTTSCNWQFFFNSINTLDGTWLEDFFYFYTREAEDELRGGISCIGWSHHKSGKLGWGLSWVYFFSLFFFFQTAESKYWLTSISIKAFYSTTIKFLN